jgi:NADH dehydrogenase
MSTAAVRKPVENHTNVIHRLYASTTREFHGPAPANPMSQGLRLATVVLMHETGPRRHRVVIVGAGFGGIAAARALRDAPVDVVIIDAHNFHTFPPLLYQVATAGLDTDDIAYAVRGIFRRQRNVDVALGRVTAVDVAQRVLTITDHPPLAYDTLVLAAGTVSADFGIAGVREHTIGLKSMADALAVRDRILRCFERAAAEPQLVDDGLLTVAIVGGGPTGVELAGGTQELFTRVLRRDFPSLDLRRSRVVVIEAADRLLGPFAPHLSDKALRTLRARGVEVVLGTGVARVDGPLPDSPLAGSVVLADGRVVPAGTIVWATGVTAAPLAHTMIDADPPVETTRGGRIVVEPDLRLPGHPEVFVIGDIAATRADDGDGELLPQVAQPAIQGGRYAARAIVARLAGDSIAPFRYRDKGSMATIGRNAAVCEFPNGWTLSGRLGWIAWLGLHLIELVGFRNRANVLVNWGWNYLTYDRGSRLIAPYDDAPLG